MKHRFKRQVLVAAMCGVFGLFADNAFASVSFNSYATINFSVANIESASSDYSGLTMSGSFMRSGVDPGDYFPDTWTNTTGDASVTDNNPPIPTVSGPVVVGSAFSHTFGLTGSVSDGTIDLNQVGWYDLGFSNSALESFAITLNYSYELATEVVGQEGNTGVSIEYFDDAFDTYGLDTITASSAQPELAIANSFGEGQITFTLDPFNNSRIFYINLNHTGYLEATAAVPLPGAVWLFLSGMFGIFGVKKRRAAIA